MKAHEIMSKTCPSRSVRTRCVREVAALMTENRISGFPVVSDDGTVVGIVSESDLLRRAENRNEAKRKLVADFLQRS